MQDLHLVRIPTTETPYGDTSLMELLCLRADIGRNQKQQHAPVALALAWERTQNKPISVRLFRLLGVKLVSCLF